MQFAIPSRPTLMRYATVALLACGNIATIYGAWQLRGSFGNPFGYSLINAFIPFLLLCLPLVAICALFEFRGFKLSRLVGLDVKPGESPWLSAAGFGVLGAGWVFVKGGLSDREATKAEAALAKPTAAEPHHKPSPGREAVETVVFVVVLVLMLKLFVVEAFVIPTGSMAETLYGYKKIVTCPECGYEFPVNASDEAEPKEGRPPVPTTGYCCPNCRYENATAAKTVSWTSGDRVLVGKFLKVDDRGRVVVFKYPEAPQTSQTAQNYIKRLVGLPGETIAIYNGDLYVTRAFSYPLGPDDKELAMWKLPNTHPGVTVDEFAKTQDENFANPNSFQIVRKPDDLVLSMRRIVYDNDHQSNNLIKAGSPPRWQTMPDAGAGWKPNDEKSPKQFAHSGGEFGWLRYQNLVPPQPKVMLTLPGMSPMIYRRAGWSSALDVKMAPRQITNFMGYNAGYQGERGRVEVEGESRDRGEDQTQSHMTDSDYWVGDLILECTATFADDSSVVALELGKGEYRCRAEFSGGQVRLKRFNSVEWNVENRLINGAATRVVSTRLKPLPATGQDDHVLAGGKAIRPTGIRGGTHQLRFANVDCRLRVWVDDQPIDFGDEANYTPPPVPKEFENFVKNEAEEKLVDTNHEGWTKANDIDQPACVGASGTVGVSGLKLWRDTHYVNRGSGKVDTYFVQPGHYLCMGDNSSQSSDGRWWGLVPERLMLGRAVFTFWPFERVGFIR